MVVALVAVTPTVADGAMASVGVASGVADASIAGVGVKVGPAVNVGDGVNVTVGVAVLVGAAVPISVGITLVTLPIGVGLNSEAAIVAGKFCVAVAVNVTLASLITAAAPLLLSLRLLVKLSHNHARINSTTTTPNAINRPLMGVSSTSALTLGCSMPLPSTWGIT